MNFKLWKNTLECFLKLCGYLQKPRNHLTLLKNSFYKQQLKYLEFSWQKKNQSKKSLYQIMLYQDKYSQSAMINMNNLFLELKMVLRFLFNLMNQVIFLFSLMFHQYEKFLVYVINNIFYNNDHYSYNNDINDIFCKKLDKSATGLDIFQKVDTFFTKMVLQWKVCVFVLQWKLLRYLQITMEVLFYNGSCCGIYRLQWKFCSTMEVVAVSTDYNGSFVLQWKLLRYLQITMEVLFYNGSCCGIYRWSCTNKGTDSQFSR